MSSFYSNSQRLRSNVCSYRYPSYLMKVSPPQVISNFDSNNMLLLPKICNKYYVRKSSNSVMNNIHYNDDLSVNSNVEFNDTTSMKLTDNEFKMTNKATDDYTGFESCSQHSFGSFKKSTPRNFRYPSYLMKVSPLQVCSNFDSNNMILLPKICNKYCVRKNSNSVTNNIYCVDDLAAKSTVQLNDTISMASSSNKSNMTNKATDNNTSFDSGGHNSFLNCQQSVNTENNCLTLTSKDLETKDVMKMENDTDLYKIFIDFDNQVQFPTKVDEVKLIKICRKCHKGCYVNNFAWEKVSTSHKIKLLEIIKQKSKNQVSYSILSNLSNNNSNNNLSISKTECPNKTQDSISI